MKAAEQQTEKAKDKKVEGAAENVVHVHVEAAEVHEEAAVVHIEAAEEHKQEAEENKEYLAKKIPLEEISV
jgi:Co/Zn/Cd efflux system component